MVKKKIITLTLTLTLALGLMLTARAQDELYVYQQGGVTDTLRLSEVTNISHSGIDSQGRRHDDFVVMDVTLADGSVRQFSLAGLDSVVIQRDGERLRLVRFVGDISPDGNGVRRSLRRTSLDGDFSVSSIDGVKFYWEDGDNVYVQTDDNRYVQADRVEIYNGKRTADFFFDSGNFSAEELQVYYAGQVSLAYNEVRVSASQRQESPGSSAHIGQSGDCGTAVATKDGDSYHFMLDHKASYLCFLPYIANDLQRTVLRQVVVRSDSAIAGVFTLTPTGIVPKEDTTHFVTLITDDFVLPRQANQNACSAYMVIAPQNGSTRLTCEFTVYDTELQSTGVYTKTVDLAKVEPNMVYVISASCNNYVVDLGLPVKFMNHNMGAFAPEDYGSYYAFGELSEKATYTSNNFVPNVNVTGPEIRLTDYDVAHVKLGGKACVLPRVGCLQEGKQPP